MGGTRLGVGSACQPVREDTGWAEAASEDMDDDYPAARPLDRLTDEVKPNSSIGSTTNQQKCKTR